MNHEEGGGASQSTDPARGSSSATDVSLREYMGAAVRSLDRHLSSEINALRRETEAANTNSNRAIEVAAHEAAERLKAHNGLIEQMQQQASHFASRDSLDDFKDSNDKRLKRIEGFQATLLGGILLLSFIGIANLVKVWTG